MIEPLPLIKSKKEWFYLTIILFIIFIINLSYLYYQYNIFKSNEIFNTNATVINIYSKPQYQILKLQNNQLTFYTSYSNKNKLQTNDIVDISIITNKITFINYLKGFYALSFNIYKTSHHFTLLEQLQAFVSHQHKNPNITQIYNALFFAIPVNQNIKTFSNKYGISHLLAISGFHLSVLSFIFYWILYFLYKPIANRYFPYRNIKFDILKIVIILLFGYIVLLGFIPSLIRSFYMFIFGIFLLRSNIKVISYTTLLLVLISLIAFFPKLLFSLSLWFSIIGVFYIFLFLQYFKHINQIIQFFLFNIWIYLAINPIIHLFFPTISTLQLYSPIFTILFTLFYPLELILHIISYGNLLDYILEILLNTTTTTKEFQTPLVFGLYYIFISLLAIRYKKIFILQNISFIIFNIVIFFML